MTLCNITYRIYWAAKWCNYFARNHVISSTQIWYEKSFDLLLAAYFFVDIIFAFSLKNATQWQSINLKNKPEYNFI